MDLVQTAQQWRAEGASVVGATVIDTVGSVPRQVGATLVVGADGQVEGSVSGGCVESDVVAHALEVLSEGTPRVVTYGISDEAAMGVGLACGGKIAVYIDPQWGEVDGLARVRFVSGPAAGATAALGPDGLRGSTAADLPNEVAPDITADARAVVGFERPALLRYADHVVFVEPVRTAPDLRVFGAPDIAVTLVPIAKDLGFDVTVSDHRPVWARPERFPAAQVIQGRAATVLESHPLGPRSYVVTLSHDHDEEIAVLKAARAVGVPYVGVLGSAKSTRKRNSLLADAGWSRTEIDSIDAPIGVDLGGKQPAEIAVAIAARLVEVRNRGAADIRGERARVLL